MRIRNQAEVIASIADLNGNVIAGGVAIKIDKEACGSFRIGPAESIRFDMDRPRVYRLILDDGRCGDIETQGFHLIDNSGTNFVSFRILNGLNYPKLQTRLR